MLDEALAVLDRTVESDPDQQADATPQPSGGLWRRLGLAPAVGGAEAGKAWSARLYFGFWVGRLPFASMERWQTGYAPVYALWAAAVVVAFPPLFSFA